MLAPKAEVRCTRGRDQGSGIQLAGVRLFLPRAHRPALPPRPEVASPTASSSSGLQLQCVSPGARDAVSCYLALSIP